MPALFHDFGKAPLSFQMGVPSQAAFPFMLWSRLMVRGARAAAAAPVAYPDPRGDPLLRAELVSYLAIARGIQCSPSQVLVTSGFSGALALAVRGLRLEREQAWMEDPGFPLTRSALTMSGLKVIGVPVDEEGLQVARGIDIAPGAALAVVTPGQQAPLGITMSLPRRLALLAWARQNGSWIIEDDYLSELQLEGRAVPALASLDHNGRVLHAGSFSKTISPTLRLGFLVVPPELAQSFGDVAACLAPAPAAAVQRATAEFLREGHHLRHLRRMKRLYQSQRKALLRCLSGIASETLRINTTAGLAVLTTLPPQAHDVDIALKALPYGLAPVPLSPWYSGEAVSRGLLLGVTNIDLNNLEADCRRLVELAR
jgi:GntR family transcriptional regulator/MocR family aminotransferase